MQKLFHRIAVGSRFHAVSQIPCRTIKELKPNVQVPTLLDKTKFKFGFGDLQYPLRVLNAAGENMFVICAEYPVFENFVETLGIPDTFQSWFSLTCLHMWMCLVRLRQEGVEGQLLKKKFIELFWMDLRARIRTFKVLRKQHQQVLAFRMQFYGAIFAYDEGFLSHSDVNLCTALWRNVFLSSPTMTAANLELLLKYTRKNIAHLNDIPSTTILRYGTPTFLPLMSDSIKTKFANERLKYCLSYPTVMA